MIPIKNQWTILLVFCFVITFFGCSSKKVIAPEIPIPLPIDVKKDFYSDIIINYRFDKNGIKDTFNRAIALTFKDPFMIPDYDMKLTMSKPKEATVEIEGKQILVIVPVSILAEKSTFLADLKAKGILEMSFVSDIGLDSMWNFKTKTSLVSNKWLEKPKLSIGAIKIPIETISNAVIRRTKASIESTIDESIKESFTIKQSMNENMAVFQNPMRLSPDFNGWLSIKPEKILISSVKNEKFVSRGKLQMRLNSQFTTVKPTPTPKFPLPKVHWSETIPDSSTFRLAADISMADINEYIKGNFDGRKFEEQGKSITISNTQVSSVGGILIVSTSVTGSINGNLIIKTKPVYDATKNEIFMDIVNVGLKTKNVALKVVAWLAEGKVRKEMEQKLHFPLNSYLADIQSGINQQIDLMNKQYDMELNVKLGSITVDNLDLKPGQLIAVFKSKLWLDVFVKDFRSFGKM